jgi:hypothetical protein
MEGMMSTSTGNDLTIESGVESRVLKEGYGPGAWHGPDLEAALADVPPALAFWRPAAGRHNIAEIALHHAYSAEPFVVPGEDWFDLNGEQGLSWPEIRAAVASEHQKLGELTARLEAGTASSALSGQERFGLVLGITCHAIYHAGQVQLIKRLHRG